MKYKYIVFDFNGTIIDDVNLCFEILNILLEERGYEKVSMDKYKDIFTFPIRKYYENAGFDLSKDSFDEISHEFIQRYQPESLKCKLYPYVVEMLQKLKQKGYKLILLSASQIDNLIEQVKYFGIFDLFDKILGTDNIHAKGKIDIAQNFFKESNESKLFVGDTLHDYEVAKEMNGDICLVSFGHQSRKVLSTVNQSIIDSYLDLDKILGE